MLCYVRLGQVRFEMGVTGLDYFVYIFLLTCGQLQVGQVRLDQVRLGQVRFEMGGTGWEYFENVFYERADNCSQVRLGQVRFEMGVTGWEYFEDIFINVRTTADRLGQV